MPMRFARFELSLKKTRKKREKKKQIKIEMRFEFFMFYLRKMRDTNQATKIKKNQTRFEIFFENSLEKYKEKTKLDFLCFLLFALREMRYSRLALGETSREKDRAECELLFLFSWAILLLAAQAASEC